MVINFLHKLLCLDDNFKLVTKVHLKILITFHLISKLKFTGTTLKEQKESVRKLNWEYNIIYIK